MFKYVWNTSHCTNRVMAFSKDDYYKVAFLSTFWEAIVFLPTIKYLMIIIKSKLLFTLIIHTMGCVCLQVNVF